MTSNSKIFYTRTLKSIFSSILLTYVTTLLLSLQSILNITLSIYCIFYVPISLAAVSSFVIVTSRKYVKTNVPCTTRFSKIVKGLSISSLTLATLCSASAWFLCYLNPFRHSENWYLLNVGCALAGVLYYYEHVYFNQDFHFPIIQTTKYSMFMSKLSEIILKSMKKSFVYVFFILIPLYAIEPTAFIDIYFFVSLWFSILFIFYLFYSFEHIVYLTMTERVIFPIVTTSQDCGTLLNALNIDIKIIKSLALYDLYQATIKDADRRKEIFNLSFAGNVPQSWKIIFNYCVNNIKTTTEEMTNLVNHISPKLINRRNIPNARLLQVNGHANSKQDEESMNKQSMLLKIFEKFRVYNYFFGQLDKEKMLEDFEVTVWCCYILSNLAVVSLKEDEYGIVREHLHQIVSAILDLKNQLELQRRHFVDDQKSNKMTYLKIHVKSCAVMLALHFAKYANDIGLDDTRLHCFKKIILLNNC